jgi:uncharacterized membrane protein
MAGRAASKLGLGSKLVGANGSGGDDEPSGEEEPDSNGDESVPVPIQEAVTVAVPIGLAYRLATSFEDYPQFLDHAHGVDVASESEVEFDARLHGTPTRVGIEIVDVRENERIDWRGTEGPQHTGSVSFHELAPRLTHIELSVDLEPQGVVQRLSRAIHLSNHAVRTEMQRFKAFAELYEGDEDEEFEPDDESDEEPSGDDEPVDQEPADDEGPEDDEEVVDEDELDEDELVDEEELDEDEELVDEEELDEDEDEEPIDDEDIEDEEVVDEDEEIEDDEEALEEERAA